MILLANNAGIPPETTQGIYSGTAIGIPIQKIYGIPSGEGS